MKNQFQGWEAQIAYYANRRFDWTNVMKIEEGGFKINRNFPDKQSIFNEVIDDDGNIRIQPKDIEPRSGVTKNTSTILTNHQIEREVAGCHQEENGSSFGLCQFCWREGRDIY